MSVKKCSRGVSMKGKTKSLCICILPNAVALHESTYILYILCICAILRHRRRRGEDIVGVLWCALIVKQLLHKV